MTAYIVQGDALHLPVPDESVDLIVTSPPYFALRSYQDDGAHYAGQIGSEETPQLFLEALWAATEEMVRVLKPSGSIFVDLGDKYAGSGAPGTTSGFVKLGMPPDARVQGARSQIETGRYNQATIGGARAKSLMLLPERYRIGCVDRLGLIAREVLVWNKPNGLPESVRDRARRSHEDWVHLTKSPSYFSAVDEIREPQTGTTHARRKDGQHSPKEQATIDKGFRRGYFPETYENPLGKLPGSVWSIPSEPLLIPDYFVEYEDGSRTFVWAGQSRKAKRGGEGDGLFELAGKAEVFPGLVALWREVHRRFLNGERRVRVVAYDHFAAFPQEWPRRLILGWSPSGICVSCGEGRTPIVSRERAVFYGDGNHVPGADQVRDGAATKGFRHEDKWTTDATITGYACACPEPTAETAPARILDPFGGTGTVALVANALGREGISIDLSHDYCRLAEWRCKESGHGRKALSKTWGERQQTMLGAAQ